jgi:hypothetical protein
VTNRDARLNVPAPGVLGNDRDPDGDAVALVSDVSNGKLILDPNGSFDYTPEANFNGTDRFTYLANDGASNSNIATVTIRLHTNMMVYLPWVRNDLGAPPGRGD